MTHFPECNQKHTESFKMSPSAIAKISLSSRILLAKHHETDPFLKALVAQTWRLVDLHGRSPFLGRVQKKRADRC